GVVHSVLPEGNMYLPWLLDTELQRSVSYQFASAYLALALLFLALSFTGGSQDRTGDPGECKG
ncbi:MAG: hypothetical protein AB1558_04350, partial [Thermodesulfobacteriota bacterium]